MSGYYSLETTRVIAAVVVIIVDAAACGISITTLCRVRRRKDPARISFLWLKCTYVLFAIALTVDAGAVVMKTIASTSYLGQDYYYATKVVAQVAEFLLELVPVAIVVTLALFDEGIRMMRLDNASTISRLPHRIAYTWFTITVLIIIVTFSGWLFVIRGNLPIGYSPNPPTVLLDPRAGTLPSVLTILDAVRFTLTGLGIVTVTIRAIYLRVRTRRLLHLRRLTNYYLTCACLMLLTVIYIGLASLIDIPFDHVAYSGSGSEGLTDLVSCVLVLWPYFIVLTILFAEGLKKRNSLSTIREAPLMQEVESSAGLAPTATSTAPDTTETSTATAPTTTEPAMTPLESPPVPAPVIATTAGAASMPQYQANTFSWPIPPDEAPPEYSLPQRPLGHLEIPPHNPNISSRNMEENEDPTLPEHDEAMGLNHQADGLRPRRNSLPEDWKHGMKKN